MNDLPNTRQSLIIRLKLSSNDAWAEFLTVYEQAIYRFCRSRGLQDADARDVTQDVFSALHSRIDRWETSSDRGSFRAWLFRVARNIAVDKTRERSRRPTPADDVTLAGLPESNENAESAFQYEYQRTLFHWAADHISREVHETTWQCFWKTAVQHKKASDVAEILSVSVGSVYTAKCRVVARIKEKLSELSDHDEGSMDAAELASHLRSFSLSNADMSSHESNSSFGRE